MRGNRMKREVNIILWCFITFHSGVPQLLSSDPTDPTDLSGDPFSPYLGQ